MTNNGQNNRKTISATLEMYLKRDQMEISTSYIQALQKPTSMKHFRVDNFKTLSLSTPLRRFNSSCLKTSLTKKRTPELQLQRTKLQEIAATVSSIKLVLTTRKFNLRNSSKLRQDLQHQLKQLQEEQLHRAIRCSLLIFLQLANLGLFWNSLPRELSDLSQLLPNDHTLAAEALPVQKSHPHRRPDEEGSHHEVVHTYMSAVPPSPSPPTLVTTTSSSPPRHL